MSESTEEPKKKDPSHHEVSTAETQPEEESPWSDLEREELESRLTEREEQVEDLQRQLEEVKESNLRKAAELDNYRKRVQRERSQIYETAKANALEDFLHINDDLRRTLRAASELDVNETFMDGVQLIAGKFEEVLKEHGVERIDEEMVPFDVDLHDAMMRQKPDDEEVGSDVVLQVIENGYRINDRTIRHAKVIVSE